MRSTTLALLTLLLAAALPGCVVEDEPAAPVTDGSIGSDVDTRFMRDDPDLTIYVHHNIYEGRVLLTGDVPRQGLADRAVADAWRAQGVTEVINDLHVGPPNPSTSGDGWILTKLGTAIAIDPNISGSHFSLQCVDGVVYVLGVADSHAEHNRVLNHARAIDGVRKVVSYILIRPPGEGPPPPAAPRRASPPAEELGPAPEPASPDSTPASPPARGSGDIETVPLQ